LKRIEQQHNVRIRIPQQDDVSETVTIQALGDGGGGEAAKKEFESILGFQLGSDKLTLVEFDVPLAKFGLVIGKQGATLKDLQNKSNCSITVPKSEGNISATGSASNLALLVPMVEKVINKQINIIKSDTKVERKQEAKMDITSKRISEVLFFPEESGSDVRLMRMIAFLRAATKTLDIAIFTMSDDRISGAVEDAKNSGVQVRVLTHAATMSEQGNDIQLLANVGIPVRAYQLSQSATGAASLMHHKFAVVDGVLLVNGSFNWTRGAAEGNCENVVISNDSQLVKPFVDHFETLWRDQNKFKAVAPVAGK